MNTTESLQEKLEKAQGKAFAVSAILIVLSLILWGVSGSGPFWQAYLLGYILVVGISAGSLGFLMLHHLTGGHWGFALRKILEANTRLLPVMVVLFVPIVVGGMNHLYGADRGALQEAHASEDGEAGHAETSSHGGWYGSEGDPVLEKKSAYLNFGGFLMRAVIIFLVWGGLAFFLNKWSTQQDETGDVTLNRPMRILSGPGVVLYVLAATVAGWDWVMSLEPHWFSSMYGPIFFISQGLTTLAFCIIVGTKLSKYKPLSDKMPKVVFHDIGTLTFAFGVLWAYTSIGQYLIIWAANLPEEIPYYIARSGTGWNIIAVMLALFHFAVPFMILLMRHAKLNKNILIKVAYWILVMRGVDLYWQIMPAFYPEGFTITLIHIVLPITLLSVYVWCFLGQLRRRPLLPLHDPRFEASPVTTEAVSHG
jgi:hypothetical protein